MALSPARFSLDQALAEIWDSDDYLTDEQKALIGECLAEQGAGERPESEEDLDILHRVVTACDYLSSIGEGEIHWLSEYGREFPSAIRTFITAVAWYFHHHDDELSDEFLAPLAAFIDETQSHLATLNYDNLLYQELIERQVLRGYDGSLVDGIHRSGFDEVNMKKKYGRDFGYYMHLHGSPLFIDSGRRIIKQRQGEAYEVATPHIVLTHVEHKPSVIDASYLLKTYWKYFGKALLESDRVLLFGYSGLDTHLNRFIKARVKGKDVCVVESSGTGEIDERHEFWTDELGEEVNLQHMDNILEFHEWDECDENA